MPSVIGVNGEHTGKATEFPKDVQVTRGWIVVKVAMTGRKSGLFQKSPRDVVRAFTRSRHVLSSNHAGSSALRVRPKSGLDTPFIAVGILDGCKPMVTKPFFWEQPRRDRGAHRQTSHQ